MMNSQASRLRYPFQWRKRNRIRAGGNVFWVVVKGVDRDGDGGGDVVCLES